MKRSTVLVALVLGLSASLALIYSSRTPPGPGLDVGFDGVTNIAGVSYAVFTLRAARSIWVDVADPMIVLRQRPPVIGGGFILNTRLASSGPPTTLKVAVPETKDQWRVAFYFHQVSLGRRMEEIIARSLGMFGLQLRARSIVLSTAYSDWMEPTLQMDWLDSQHWLDASPNDRWGAKLDFATIIDFPPRDCRLHYSVLSKCH